MPTLILSPRHSPDSITMRAAAINRGWEVIRSSSYADIYRLLLQNENEDFVGNVAVYGEDFFTQLVMEHMSLWPKCLLGRDVCTLPIEYTKRKITHTIAKKQIYKNMFVKPAEIKMFQAQVYDTFDCSEWPEEPEILISKPMFFMLEYRYFVSDNKIQTSSYYKGENYLFWEHKNKENFDKFVQKVINELPGSTYVLDAGITENLEPAIVEINQPYNSGIYNCDPYKVLDVLADCFFF